MFDPRPQTRRGAFATVDGTIEKETVMSIEIREGHGYICHKLWRLVKTVNGLCEDAWLLRERTVPGIFYIGEIFRMRSARWDGCTCGLSALKWIIENNDEPTPSLLTKEHGDRLAIGAHNPGCAYGPDVPNFQYRDIEVHWKSFIGNPMTVNRPIEKKEWEECFRRCNAAAQREKKAWKEREAKKQEVRREDMLKLTPRYLEYLRGNDTY